MPEYRSFVVGAIGMGFGGMVGFFTAGPALFADGTFFESLLAVAVGVPLVFVIGLGVGALDPVHPSLVGLAPVAGLLPTVAFLTEWDRIDLVELAVVAVVAFAAAGMLGGRLGAHLRSRRPVDSGGGVEGRGGPVAP
ncbi:MAG: hypothetical protein Q7V61_03785 [Actinomycetota bacterium]|nr:hypothetical protein [Actinomycetota bacterium]